MEEPRQPESFSSFRNVSEVAYYVRNKVELCIQNYMSLEVTAEYLEKNHRISKSVTRIVWEQLREENPDFFSHFEMRCQMALQMRMFNDMLTKQVVGMFENGLIDISDASPSVKTLLRRQHPERVHLLETLASKSKLSSASLVALPNANGPSGESFTNFAVAQTEILYNQEEQVLNPASFAMMPNPSGASVVQSQNPYDQVLNFASFAMPNPIGPSVEQSHMSNDQFNDHIYSALLAMPDANGPPVMQFHIPYAQQDQHLYTTSLPLPYANVTLADNGHNQFHQDPLPAYNGNYLGDPTFAPLNTDDLFLPTVPAEFADLAVLPPLPPADTIYPWSSSDDFPYIAATMPEEDDLSTFDLGDVIGFNGPSFLDENAILASMDFNEQQQHQHLWQQQHQQQQNVQVQGSNGVVNGESNGEHHQCVDHQQQAGGGAQHHHPESEALNNPDTGYIGHNGVSDLFIQSEVQIVTQPGEQTQHQNGHHQPQEHVPVETLQTGGISNGVVNGESSDHQHSKRVCTSVDQQQAGRVKRHHPESEGFNNSK